MKQPLLVLTGPTAVGKTELSILLANEVNGSVISADSMQVYRHMDIGSAKIRPQEMGGVPHYLIDALEPWEDFNVARFQEMARSCMEEINAAGRIPILTGGTGFYIQAILYGIDFISEPQDQDCRRRLEELAGRQGSQYLHEMLAQVDPEAAGEIHPNNRKRVIRALEFHHLTGERISEHNRRERQRESPYQFCYFVLNDRRDLLYERIDRRVDQMMEAGLLDEVKALREMGCTREMVSMQGLGYKELLRYLDGEATLEDAVAQIKQGSRHFAKRQLTWFRRERDVIWVNKADFGYDNGKIMDYMKQKMTECKVAMPYN